MERNQPPKLSAREAAALTGFLNHSDRPRGTLSFHELQGFLFAIACAPELIGPSEWLPLISNEEDMRYTNLHEAQRILGLIMVLYNQINAAVIERSDAMPSGLAFLADTIANLDEQVAEAFYRESRGRGSEVDPDVFGRLAETMRRLFPSALASYADVGRSIAAASRSES